MIVQIILILFIAVETYLHYKERQKLLDRIQAGGFNEYKKFEDKSAQKPKDKKESINEYANLI